MSEPSDLPLSPGLDRAAEDPADHDVPVDRDTRAGHVTGPGSVQGDRTVLVEPGGGPDPLDALRAELSMIGQQPVADRVERFEHANVVLAAALAELDEV